MIKIMWSAKFRPDFSNVSVVCTVGRRQHMPGGDDGAATKGFVISNFHQGNLWICWINDLDLEYI